MTDWFPLSMVPIDWWKQQMEGVRKWSLLIAAVRPNTESTRKRVKRGHLIVQKELDIVFDHPSTCREFE